MPYLGNPYEPIAQMGQNMMVYSNATWGAYVIDYVEPLAASSALTVDYGAVAAGGMVAATLAQSLRLDDGYLVELWMRPIEDFEIVLWLRQGQQKFRIKNAQARIGYQTALMDPMFLSSKFYVLGKDRDPYIEVRNPRPYVLGSSNVSFWGNKYLLVAPSPGLARKMLDGDAPATRIVAESRVA